MPRGYRCIVLAAFGWLVLAAAPSPDNGTQANQSQATDNIDRSLATIANAQAKQADIGEYQAPCGEGEYNNQSDLCAQWYAARAARDAADWAYWGFWLGVFSLGFSAVGLGALLVTIRQGREANRIARSIGQAQTRAYLSIISLEGQTTTRGLVFRVMVQNSGQSPALSAQVMLEIVDKRGKKSIVMPEQEHHIPAQSSHEMAFCYFKHRTAATWERVVVLVTVAYSDVFLTFDKLTDKFVGVPVEWSRSDFTELVKGRHIASYLRAMNPPLPKRRRKKKDDHATPPEQGQT